MINFIVNLRSGKGLGNKTLKKLCDYCYKNSVPFTAHITAEPKHATRIAKALCENDAKTIVAVGGDGTFSEVLNGVDFEKTTLGFIPAGRGNDYARNEKISRNPITALKDILRGEVIHNDYIEVNGKRCLNVTGTGLDVAVLKRVMGKSDKISYLKALVYCLKHFQPYKLSVTVDGETTQHDCIMVGMCNGYAFGGGIKLAPPAKINDGKLDVIIMRLPKYEKISSALMVFARGKHMKKEYTTHIACDQVYVQPTNPEDDYSMQIDGEIQPEKVLDCKIVAGGMRTFKITGKK